MGFDWDNATDCIAKIREEIDELQEAIDTDAATDDQILELGDLLFAVTNVARFIGADPEEALTRLTVNLCAGFNILSKACSARERA